MMILNMHRLYVVFRAIMVQSMHQFKNTSKKGVDFIFQNKWNNEFTKTC
jgi:hypothetical protein